MRAVVVEVYRKVVRESLRRVVDALCPSLSLSSVFRGVRVCFERAYLALRVALLLYPVLEGSSFEVLVAGFPFAVPALLPGRMASLDSHVRANTMYQCLSTVSNVVHNTHGGGGMCRAAAANSPQQCGSARFVLPTLILVACTWQTVFTRF